MMASRQGDLELSMLNRLDASLHPALRDWAAGDRVTVQIPWPPAQLEGTSLEWRHRSAQAFAFLLAGGYQVRQLGHRPYQTTGVPVGPSRHVHFRGVLDHRYAQQYGEPSIGGYVVQPDEEIHAFDYELGTTRRPAA